MKIDYFKNINSATKAYYLGFIHADGHVKYNPNNKCKYRFAIKISQKDLNIIIKFKKQLEIPNKIQKYTSNYNTPVCCIDIGKKQFVKHLLNINIKNPNILNKIPDKYKYAFILGCFDGDGCAVYTKRKYKLVNGYSYYDVFSWEICSQHHIFLSNIQDYFYKQLNIPKNKIHKHGSIWAINYRSKSAVTNISNHLYKNNRLPYLQRKKEKFKDLMVKP